MQEPTSRAAGGAATHREADTRDVVEVERQRARGARLETGVLVGGAGSEARSFIANAKSRNFFSG